MKRRELEQEIFNAVDRLLEVAISFSIADEREKEGLLGQGAIAVEELGQLLQKMLGGKDEYIPATIRQLVTQKLPNPNILTSFGNFTADLEKCIDEGLKRWEAKEPQSSEIIKNYQKDELKNPTAITDTDLGKAISNHQASLENQIDSYIAPLDLAKTKFADSSLDEETDQLILSLTQIFPYNQIEVNYPFHGGNFQCFLPERKLAVEVRSEERERLSRRWNYYCRKEGITWILVNPLDIRNHKRIERSLIRGR